MVTLPVSGPTVTTLLAFPAVSVVLVGSWRTPLVVDQFTSTPLIAFPKRSVAFAIKVSWTPTSAALPSPPKAWIEPTVSAARVMVNVRTWLPATALTFAKPAMAGVR